VKGGSVIYMPYSHSFLTRGNGHRVLISDVQLLQCYSQRRDIRRNPLPYSIVHNAIMDLLANRETPAARIDTPQLLITPAVDHDGEPTTPITPAVHRVWPGTAAGRYGKEGPARLGVYRRGVV
jgi:hypothetical protein